MEGVKGHHGTVQVHGSQQIGEMAGLVVPDVDLKVIQQVSAVFGGAEKMNPGAVIPPRSARRVPQLDLISMPGPAQVQCPASGCWEVDV